MAVNEVGIDLIICPTVICFEMYRVEIFGILDRPSMFEQDALHDDSSFESIQMIDQVACFKIKDL